MQKPLPIVCDLPSDRLAVRRAEIERDLRPRVREVVELDDGIELRFDSSPETVELVTSFVAFEHRCCAFLSFALSVPADGAVTLRLTGPAGTKEMLQGASLRP